MTESVDLSHHSDPSSPPSVCPTTPFLPSPLLPSSFLTALRPSTVQTLFHLVFVLVLTSLLPFTSLFPPSSFITTIFLPSRFVPRIYPHPCITFMVSPAFILALSSASAGVFLIPISHIHLSVCYCPYLLF